MKLLLKGAATIIAACILLFAVAASFSTVESRFECVGELSSQQEPQPATIFLKHHDYRWWVSFWSDSSGAVWLEYPTKTVEYYGKVTKAGDLLQLFDWEGSIKGSFSTLSKSLSVQIPVYGFFTGTCIPARQ